MTIRSAELAGENLKVAYERLRARGRLLLDFPWEPDDLGKLLFRLNQIAHANSPSPEELAVARSLIRSAELLIEQAEHEYSPGATTEQSQGKLAEQVEDEAERGESLLADLEIEIENLTNWKPRGDAAVSQSEHGLQDSSRGPLWNMVSWSLEPIHKASDERYWYIVAARIGLYNSSESLESIGTYLNITKERTRQIESKILDALQNSEEAWATEWQERAASVCSSDISDFCLLFDAVINHGADWLHDPDALLPEVGQMLFRSGLVRDTSELETWARYRNWMDLDGESEVLMEAYRRIARGERRDAVIPGSAELRKAVRLVRDRLRHNGACDIDEILQETPAPEAALLLALGRANNVTHIPGTNWVVLLGETKGSLRARIGKILSNLGPLTARQLGGCLAKPRSGRESYATNIPEHVVATILDLTPGVSRSSPSGHKESRWQWNQSRLSLGETSDLILEQLRKLSAPFSRNDAYRACQDIAKVSVDVFISGPLCETLSRDAHQLVGTNVS